MPALRYSHVDSPNAARDRRPSVGVCADFHDAIRGGDAGRVDEMLDAQPALLDARAPDGATPLMAAAESRQAEVVRRLLARGANAKLTADYGKTCLDRVDPNDLEIIRLLVTHDRTLADRKGRDGRTLLMRAALSGDRELTKVLLDAGVDTTLRAPDGCQAVNIAATCGHRELVEEFVRRNPACVNARGTGGDTPLIRAAMAGHADFVQWLLEHGADASMAGYLNCNAFECAIVLSHREVVARFVNHDRALVNRAGQVDAMTPLMVAATVGAVEIAKALLDAGADTSARNAFGRAAIHHAATCGHVDIVEELVTRDPTCVDTRTATGDTPLLEATQMARTGVVQKLLALGADASIAGGEGWNALHFAAEDGDDEIVNLLAKAIDTPGPNGMTALMLAAQGGKLSTVMLLAQYGASLRARNGDGETALFIAACHGREAVVNYLMSKALSLVDIARNDDTTPLMAAVIRRGSSIFRCLLDAGANVHTTRATDGASVLFLAAATGETDLIVPLLDLTPSAHSFALANQANRWGTLPISVAAGKGWANGVSLIAPNGSGKTAAARSPRPRPDGTPRELWVLRGVDIPDDPGFDAKAGLRGDVRVQPLGQQKQGVGWHALLDALRARGDFTAGTCCMVHAHGSASTDADPQHRLDLVKGDQVATTALVRELVRRGARDIHVWSCFASNAAEELANMIALDPHWPKSRERLQVTFHGESDTLIMTELGLLEMQRMAHDVGRPADVALSGVLSVIPSRSVTFDPATGQVTMDRSKPDTAQSIQLRLQKLGTYLLESERRELVGDFMLSCCLDNRWEQLEECFRRFGDRADVNWQRDGWSLIDLASAQNHTRCVEVLQKRMPAPSAPVTA